MKKTYNQLLSYLMIGLVGLLIVSCNEDTDGSPQIDPGSLNIQSILPDTGAGGAMLTLTGTGMGAITSIVFEKNNIPAGFYSTLNTDKNILFRVPEEAIGGDQNIILTNRNGKTTTVPFRVLAYPSIASVSNYNFTEGSQITLTGNNLDDVTSVVLAGTTSAAKIVSQEKKSMVIEFPDSDITRAQLVLTNTTGSIRTTQEFVNIDQALGIFTDDYAEGFSDGSWGDAGVIGTSDVKSGTKSISKSYQKGNWHLIGFNNWWPSVEYSSDYQYFSVWIKGASEDYSLYLTTNTASNGFGDYNEKNALNVKAGVWNYFKLRIADIDFWKPGSTLTQVGFRIKGPDKQDETFIFDDIMLIK